MSMLTRITALLALVVMPVGATVTRAVTTPAAEPPAWALQLQSRIDGIDGRFPGELGVFVQDLRSGESFSYRADESWYLASGVKVPVAIAVLRAVERGELDLDSELRLQQSDYVDGAGETNLHRPGAALSVEYLLEQMLVHSDNTATDVLIRTVGLDRVNGVARELISGQCGRITTLADVRRHAYSGFHEKAFELTSVDLLALKQARGENARLQRLAEILGVSPEQFGLHDLDSAFDAYYATDLNAASLRAYGAMLIAVVEGRALGPRYTRYLLDVLARVQTGRHRIRAGLPAGTSFAHKTGTQHRRACDFGIATSADGRRVVIAACGRGDRSLVRSERALREVGAAVAATGLLSGDSVADMRR